MQLKDRIAVATNSRSMMFVTIVSCVRWLLFLSMNVAHFLFFFPLGQVQKVKSASHHVVLAPWRSGPVGMFYNPLESEFKPPCFFCF